MRIDCVFSGGGMKAFAFLGALQSIDEKNLKIERTAGTSAGAILASLIAARYKTDEIIALFEELNLKNLLDPPIVSKRFPFLKWIMFYFQMGLYKGDMFENWLSDILAQKGIVTFSDIKDSYLKIVVSDVSLGKLIVIPDDLERVYGIDPNTFKVATAVRMSASFPYFFMPKKIINQKNVKSYIVDGGLLSNFPLWIFRESDRDKRPVLGVTLSDSLENQTPYKINHAFDLMHALFHAMLRAHDARYISNSMKDNIIFIPVKDIKTMDFSISDKDKHLLMQLGKEKAEHFLQFWP